jgi:hypothetical protein
MTLEIGEERRQRALHPTEKVAETAAGRSRLVTGIGLFGAAVGVTGLVLVGLDIANDHGLHYTVYAAACFVLTGLAGSLLCFRAMLAECQVFYRRGHIEGWHKGWNGQLPETGDPLLR